LERGHVGLLFRRVIQPAAAITWFTSPRRHLGYVKHRFHKGCLSRSLVANDSDVSDVLGLGRGHAEPFAVPVSPRTFSSVFATAGWIVQAALARSGRIRVAYRIGTTTGARGALWSASAA